MTAILRAWALGFVLLLTGGPLARAADQTITLEPGAEWALLIERSFETVLIGDPDVVDVHTRGDRSVVLEALKLVTRRQDPSHGRIVQLTLTSRGLGTLRECDAAVRTLEQSMLARLSEPERKTLGTALNACIQTLEGRLETPK